MLKPFSAIAVFGVLCLSALAPREAAAERPRGRDRVCVYEHANYEGREECFGPGETIRDLGPRRDTISSIRIRGDVRVTLYEHPQFGGREIRIDNDVPDLNRVGGWNDEVDSLRIGRDGGGPKEIPRWGDRDRDRGGDRVCVYEHADFRGNSQCFGAGDDVRDLGSIGWNDGISSIRVFGRSRMAVYEHNNYNGQELMVDRDIQDLTRVGWNDRVSSLRIGGGDRDRR